MAEDVRNTLRSVVRLMQQNQHDAAESICRNALERWANDVNLVAMLGAVLASRGEIDEAQQQLRLAISIEPDFAKPYEDLAALHLARNDYAGAIPLFHKALELSPHQALSLQGLGLALQMLAKTATDEKRFAVAEGYLKQVAELAPNRPDGRFQLARFLHDRGRLADAISELEAATRLAPDDVEILSYLGNLLGIVGRTDDALRTYEDCLARSPDEPAALIGRGHMLRMRGRTEEARESYARCTRIHPEIGSAWWYLASMHGYVAGDEDRLTMQQQLDTDAADPESEVGFHFALGRAFENTGEYDVAWQHYELGNACKRRSVSYDASKLKQDNERIKTRFSAAFFAGDAANTPADRTPIFIVGMPRSGSTLAEQILASHSQVDGCGELPAIISLTSTLVAKQPGSTHYSEIMPLLSSDELTGLGRSYLHHAAVHRSDSCRYFTDKMPANFPHIGFIMRILPHARIIDARRNPLATCVANYRQLFAQGKNQTYDLHELADYYLQYVDLMQHWDSVLPGKVLRLQYEDVIADIEGQVRRLLDFCGLPFESSCIEFHKSQRAVNTASAEQVRKPLYATGLDFWEHYDDYLDELRNVLAPIL